MTVTTAGTGDRQLYVSYISEVPIWKTTYRIVLPSKAGDQPFLQGWAIVDNTVGEDWNNVELSLVAGAPQSFIQQLSQPYYARRPVVPLPGSTQLAPQTHEGAMLGGSAGLSGVVLDQSGAVISGARVTITTATGGSAGSTTTDSQGRYSFGDLFAANYGLRVEYPGFQSTVIQGLSLGGGREATQNVTLTIGSSAQTVTVTAEASALNAEESETAAGTARNVGSGGELGTGRGAGRGLAAGGGGGRPVPPPPPNEFSKLIPSGEAISLKRASRWQSSAEGADLGDLFQYKLKDRVTIHKNESALVPDSPDSR